MNLHSRPPDLDPVVTTNRWHPVEAASYVLIGLGLALILWLKLLGALLAGLLVFHLIHRLAPLLAKRLPGPRARLIALIFLSTIIVGLLTLATLATITHFRSQPLVSEHLFSRAMGIIDQARAHLPAWIDDYLPADTEDVRYTAAQLVREHMVDLRSAGTEVLRGLAHVVIGMILGAIVAVDATHIDHRRPLSAALSTRVTRLAEAFRRIVFAQMKISLVNTIFTAIFLLGALPLFGIRLPLSKTLVILTFLIGLLPVLGNLISNAAILVVALSIGLPVTLAALVFLVVIHKLEYFLNARIVGGEIDAHAWELLIVMMAMEAAFGLAGVMAAPIYYAYVKRELKLSKLV